MDRQRMDAARKLGREQLINHAVAFEPALPAERLRYNIHPEMGLAARPVPGVPRVVLRLVLDVQALRRKRGAQLLGDLIFHQHGVSRKGPGCRGQPAGNISLSRKNVLSSLEGVFDAFA
jgi:hypothetical protein